MTFQYESQTKAGESADRAVSPVIGVILMVAITVILAAVIATFVLGIGPGDAAPTAGADVSHTGGDTVEVQLTDASEIDGVALVDSADGNVTAVDENANTGATVELSGEHVDEDGIVYGYVGEITEDADSIDEADGSIELGTVDDLG